MRKQIYLRQSWVNIIQPDCEVKFDGYTTIYKLGVAADDQQTSSFGFAVELFAAQLVNID